MKTGYKVSDVMTEEPIFVAPMENIVSCSQIMSTSHVGALLVAEGKTVKGICTEQDIVRKVIAKGKDPSTTQVVSIIDANVRVISPDEDIYDAMVKMRDCNIRHLPVVKNDEFVGLLTSKDILKVEPELFDVLVETIELREEEKKLKQAQEEADKNLSGSM